MYNTMNHKKQYVDLHSINLIQIQLRLLPHGLPRFHRKTKAHDNGPRPRLSVEFGVQ